MTASAFLGGDGVTLHPTEDDDAAFCADLVNDPRVRHGLSFARPKRADDEREIRVDSDDDFVPFVVRAVDDPDAGDEDDRIGVVDLFDLDEQFGTAEVGYFFRPQAWGNGYATAAVERVVDYAFDELRLHRINARVYAFNDASTRVLETVGFEREGRLREQAYMHGERVDELRYGLLESEREQPTAD